MALSINTAWEVRPTNGSDTNGGGFVAGTAGGTDFSQQNAAQIAVTDAVANGTTTITSATAGFLTTHVGNIIYLAGGTGSLAAGWYQVASITNATTIVVDRAVASGTGITLNLGGALKTLAAAAAVYLARNKIFMKAESTQQISASIGFTLGFSPQGGAPFTRVIGYTTTRSDKGQVTIQLISNTGLVALNNSAGNGLSFENFIVDCNNLGTSKGIVIGGNFSRAINCVVKNFTLMGIDAANSQSNVLSCEVTAGTSAATAAINAVSGVYNCNVHDNACTGITGQPGNLVAIGNLVTNNTGATSDGIAYQYGSVIMNNTVHGSGRDNLRSVNSYEMNIAWNNILTSGGATATPGYGLNNPAGGDAADYYYDGNTYWNNRTAARNGVDDLNTAKINSITPYTNISDKFLTSSPYVSTTDFELNNNVGAGATARGSAVQQTVPNATGVTYLDMGAFQHRDNTFGVPLVGLLR